MKKIFKLMFLIFSSMFILAKSWGDGNHYAYVSGTIGESSAAYLSRYQINEHGDFINRITQQINFPAFGRAPGRISGVAIAPDHKYLYVAYNSGIIRVHLNDRDHTLDLHDVEYYPFVNDDISDKSLAVNAHDHILYITSHASYDRKLYSYEINQANHDKLENFRIVCPVIRDGDFPAAPNSTNAGISIVDNGNIFINTNFPDNRFSISTLRMNHAYRPPRAEYGVRIAGQHADVGGSTYLPFRGDENRGGFLIMADKREMATMCLMDPIGQVGEAGCLRVDAHAGFDAHNYPTYDVDKNPDLPTILYFTSNFKVLKWQNFDWAHAPVSMPATNTIPSKYIVTF